MKYAMVVGSAFVLFSLPAISLADDNLTITTYYPSPNGVYRNLKLYPTSSPGACVAGLEGTMYFDNTTVPSAGKICHYNGAAWEWADFGASGGSGIWVENSTTHSINNTNQGKVFIDGVEDANGEILEVHGDVRVYDKPPAGDGDSLMYITRQTVGNSSGIVLDTWTGATEGYHIRLDGNTPRLDIGNTTLDFLTVDNAGNVGIGNIAPQAKLDVNGAVKLAPGAAPASPAEGTMYYDSTQHAQRFRDATQWNNLISESGAVTLTPPATTVQANFHKIYTQAPLVIATPRFLGAHSDTRLTCNIVSLTGTNVVFDVDGGTGASPAAGVWTDIPQEQVEIMYVVIPR